MASRLIKKSSCRKFVRSSQSQTYCTAAIAAELEFLRIFAEVFRSGAMQSKDAFAISRVAASGLVSAASSSGTALTAAGPNSARVKKTICRNLTSSVLSISRRVSMTNVVRGDTVLRRAKTAIHRTFSGRFCCPAAPYTARLRVPHLPLPRTRPPR